MSHRNNRGYSYEEQEPAHRFDQQRKRSHSYDRMFAADASSKRNRRGYDDPPSSADNSYYGRRNHARDEYFKESDERFDDWKCLECMTWNYPDDYYCFRCGCDPQEASSSAPPPPLVSNDIQDVDEFGRAIKKPDSSSSGGGKVPEWPPKFETNGSAFVFDARSGMFYEADSDFFYDPKTKLYYGNKKRAYYRYNDEARIPFEEVQKVDPAAEKTSAEPALAPIPRPGSSKDSSTKGISIKLKTKSLGGSSSSSSSKKSKTAPTTFSDPSPPPSSRQQKQHVADMDKWADRQVEKRVDASQERTIKRTAKGEPICTLCKRKFPTVEKLLYHERVSNLHKDNLAKQTAAAAAASGQKAFEEQQRNNYTDRAEQRRMMHGPEVVPVVPLPPVVNPEASLPITPAIEPTLPQENNLGETNIGNQLLQKMGWKEGKSLGRPVSSSSRESADSMTGSIKKDWDRIEALTAIGGRAPSSGSKAGLGKQY